jgi:hypothetical protein
VKIQKKPGEFEEKEKEGKSRKREMVKIGGKINKIERNRIS